VSNRTSLPDDRLYDHLLRKSLREPAALAALHPEPAAHPRGNSTTICWRTRVSTWRSPAGEPAGRLPLRGDASMIN